MGFKTGYCLTSKELFYNLKNREVKIPQDYYRTKAHSCSDIMGQVLTYAFKLIILDIIENNVTFLFPLFGNKEMCLYVKAIDGEEFKYAYQRGAFSDIDFLQSNFTGYRLTVEWINGDYGYEKPIYINTKVKNLFLEKINSGKRYYATNIVEVDKYFPEICERFPRLNLEQIKRIVIFGMRAFYTYTANHADILLKSPEFTLYAGSFFSDNLKFYEYWVKKSATKLRILYNRKKKKKGEDEYRYFGLNENAYNTHKDNFVFDKLMTFKIKEECLLHKEFKYFFKFKHPDTHFITYLNNYTVDNPEQIAKLENNKIIYENGN